MKIVMKFPYTNGWGYPDEFREKVIKDCLSSVSVRQVSAERKVSESTIRRWWRDVELVKGK